MGEKEKLTYEASIEELNRLLSKIENDNSSFEQIEKDVKRAMELIKFCKTELKGYKERLDTLYSEADKI